MPLETINSSYLDNNIESRVDNNETDITTNQSNIGTNQSDITINKTDFITGLNPINKAIITLTGATALGTTILPADTSIPLFDEGNAVSGLDLTFTPISTSSKIITKVIINGLIDTAGSANISVALFKDASGTDPAVATTMAHGNAVDVARTVAIRYEFANASLTSIDFKVRAGSSGATNININGGSGYTLGDTVSSWIEVEEYAV